MASSRRLDESQLQEMRDEPTPEHDVLDPISASPLSDCPLYPFSVIGGPSEGFACQTPPLAIGSPEKDVNVTQSRCSLWLDYTCILVHLAFFGITGVLIRYGLEVLFDNTLSITHEGTALYRDLPCNIVGSFFMGWVGIVFKKQLLSFSEPLAIGLSTGLMGSITTYAGWNQTMVILLTTGQVAAAVSGLLLGMAVAMMSLLVGIDSAEGLKYGIMKFQQCRLDRGLRPLIRPSADNYKRRMVSFAFFFCVAGILWAGAVVLWVKARSRQSLRILWLACIVAPPGVWARWHLARLNGQGARGRLQWLPIGTLAANLIAAGLEAGLGALLYAVQEEDIHVLIEALQLGFLGCMSTVSTFVAEVYALNSSPGKPKAYKYAFITLTLGLIVGIVLYSCPAWSKGYVHF